MDEVRERRQERRGLNARLFVAGLIIVSVECCSRVQAGLNLSDPNPGTKTEHVALDLASELYKIAAVCAAKVMISVALVPDVVEGMRRTQLQSDFVLVIASICVLISVSCLAFFRFFVVG
ncbi:hypothetical protein EUTSA_v10009704mg [Eutrema salsugineum]|uniref:Uncharacterized protein n=2 Tax=Eutrema salsugineum TaxID=72664 RepID=V4KTI8_EUTSA|nr:hypothetical protein EUTSA_v10009704mg [Eutrema salsugineum]